MYKFVKDNSKITSLRVVFSAGSLYEFVGKSGTMHLMEHLVCKTFDDYRDLFTRNCIEYNAYTDYENVVFWFNGLDDRLTGDIKVELVKRIVGGLHRVTREMFENEKNTVINEYYDSFNSNLEGNFLNIMRTRFNDDGVIGRIEDIRNFSYKDMLDAYEDYFRRPYMILETGKAKTNFDFVDYNEIRLTNWKLKYKKYKRETEAIPLCPEKRGIICIGKKVVSKRDCANFEIGLKMLTRGLNSPLYQEVREKRGLAYYVGGSLDIRFSTGTCSFYAETTKDRVDELGAVFEEFFKNIESHLTTERFNDIIEYEKAKLERSKTCKYKFAGNLIRKGLAGLPTTTAGFDKIRYENVRDAVIRYVRDMDYFVI